MIIWKNCEDVMPDTVGQYIISYKLLGHRYIEIAHIEDDVFLLEAGSQVGQFVTHWSELNLPDVGSVL